MSRKIKRILSLSLALVLVAMTAACGGTSSSQTPSTNSPSNSEQSSQINETDSKFDKKYTWSLGSTYATGTPIVETYQKFADLVSEYSNGAMTINVFPDSQLGGENDQMQAVASGELEFMGGGSGVFWLYSEDASYICTPFLVPDWESYQNLYYSDMFEQIKADWAQNHNTKDLSGLIYRGYRNMSSDRPINSVDDLKGLKLRMNSNQIWNDVWNGLGATCVSIALGELYTSMQTGVANASEIPWPDAASLKLEEVQDYIIQTQHVNEASVIYMSNSLYESLPTAYQEVLNRAAKEANEWGSELAMSMEDTYKQAFLDAGAELIIPDHDSFVEAAYPIWNKLFETTWTTTTYDEVVAMMKG